MASTDSRPVPIKNTAFRVVFPILDADGDLVTGATGLDSEVSKDQGTFADCTNEATEIATSSGMYYLDLTSTEMNADCVAVIVKTSTSGAKTTVLVFYPQESGDIKVDIQSIAGTAAILSTFGIASIGVLDAGSASAFTLPSGQRANVAAGMMIWIPGKGAARIIASGYNSSTGVGAPQSNFDSAAAASDAYIVFSLPKSEPLMQTDFGEVIDVNVSKVVDVTILGDGSATPFHV